MKLVKNIRIYLTCYCCGDINFEYKSMECREIEGMYFLENNKQLVRCRQCGLEDYLYNLVPRAILHEEVE